MTLAEMADFVCGKVRQQDEKAVQRCKGYLRQRYEMIWAEEAWRDAVWAMDFVFTPNSSQRPESWEGIYMFPCVVDRVMAVRRPEGQVGIIAPETLFRVGSDMFEEQGESEKFYTLSPCVAILPATYTGNDVGLQGFEDSTEFTITYINDVNERRKVVGAYTGPAPYLLDARIVEKVTKATSTDVASVNTNGGTVTLAVADAKATEFPLKLPIRLFPEPSAVTTFRALVKKKPIPLEEDGASPELRGVDNCLMAFAQADMLQRSRQYGKADLVVKEAVTLLGQLKAVAVVQEAHHQQIVPRVEQSSGDIGDSGNGKGYW